MWTFVGGSGQLPWGKPSLERKTAFSTTDPWVYKNALSLRHISPDAVTYEIVSVPQNIVPLYLSLVSSEPLTVPLARWPSILNSPESVVEERSFVRLALTGSTPQLDANIPLHSPVTGGGASPGPFGSSHAGRQDKAAAASRDRYMSLTGCHSKSDTGRQRRIRCRERHSGGCWLQDGGQADVNRDHGRTQPQAATDHTPVGRSPHVDSPLDRQLFSVARSRRSSATSRLASDSQMPSGPRSGVPNRGRSGVDTRSPRRSESRL
jgi:hypothetical protein